MARKGVKIKVDNEVFESIVDAANFLDVKPWTIIDALRFGKDTINGYHIERLDNKKYGNMRKAKRVTVNKSVICVDTGEVFDSISAAALSCGMNNWTLGSSFKSKGKYVARDGKTYKLNTKRNFNKPTSNLFSKTITKESNEVIQNTSNEQVLKKITIDLIKQNQYVAAQALLSAMKDLKN